MIVSVTSLSVLPQPGQAMLVPTHEMVSTTVVNRLEDMQTLQKTLESKMIQKKLLAMGLKPAEVQQRISKMSDSQVHQMASQIRALNPGGLVVEILVAVALIVLILFLIKRI